MDASHSFFVKNVPSWIPTTRHLAITVFSKSSKDALRYLLSFALERGYKGPGFGLSATRRYPCGGFLITFETIFIRS